MRHRARRGVLFRTTETTFVQTKRKLLDECDLYPHVKRNADTRTPEELLDLIEAKGREVAEALAALRSIGKT